MIVQISSVLEFSLHVAKKVPNVPALNNTHLIELIGLRTGFGFLHQEEGLDRDFRSWGGFSKTSSK